MTFRRVVVFLLIVSAHFSCGVVTARDTRFFQSARPVWIEGREREMNRLVGFRAVFDLPGQQPLRLRVACSTVYRAWINGEYLARGPARGPHDHYRVDQWDLNRRVRKDKNVIAIEVAGYNANGYQLLDQPSFLQAEVTSDAGAVVASTGGDGVSFEGRLLPHRLQKVQRYSFQRLFTEVYALQPGYDRWRHAPLIRFQSEPLAVMPNKHLLPRRVPLPPLEILHPTRHVARGEMGPKASVESLWKDRALVNIGPRLKGFPASELEVIPSLEIQKLEHRRGVLLHQQYQPGQPIDLRARDYQILDLGINATGMLGAHVHCTQPSRLWFTFDEILSNGDVDFKRLSCVNLISYHLQPGTYTVESLEPYTMRYLKLICVEGACQIRDVYLRQYRHPGGTARFRASDARLNKLYAAGLETFRQNALDLFMDCPSRERAGWLCDSFFMARVARDVTGCTVLERTFFENYLLPPRFAHLPDGMLPMCYPADHYDGVFIPNWALWFVIQLREYQARSDDHETVTALRAKVLKLLDYFQALENSDGLLERLPGWVFIEWSAANKFVQDVNYPSNMLYAGALEAAAELYQRPALRAKADRLRGEIRRQSFDGEFFVDNALRQNGRLVATGNRTEVCQYFAFYFGVATRQSHARLWATLRDDFGPNRQQTGKHAEVHPANSFVGNVLRLELLSQAGRSRQILDESVEYLLYMADRTGTLWENDGAYASCNHGFASHVVHSLYRDVLGIYRVDVPAQRVKLRFGNLPLAWCEGRLPTGPGPVRLRWQKQDEVLLYQADVPAGFQLDVTNRSGLRLQRRPYW